MSGQSWKREERTIAAALGGHRNPNNGRAQSDVTAPRFAVECKKRRSLPAWLLRAAEQARAGATAAQTPITVLSLAPRPGVPIRRFVLLDWGDWHAVVNGPDYSEMMANGGHE